MVQMLLPLLQGFHEALAPKRVENGAGQNNCGQFLRRGYQG